MEKRIYIIEEPRILTQMSEPTTMDKVLALDLEVKMIKAMEHSWVPGHGLAAIQIGVPVRFGFFVIDGKKTVLLNPQIVELKGKLKTKTEGCLSIPNKWLQVKRAQKIKYISDGKLHAAKGLKAQIIQHEIDHMNGILINGQTH